MADRDVVLIGAGITGILSALELSRRGWRVTLLEARHVGAGSSSRTAAGIRQQFSTPGTVYGMRHSVAWYKAMTAEIEEGTSPIVQNGYLFLLGDDAAVEAARARVHLQHECGLSEVELLAPEEVARRFRHVDPDAIAGATWCPTDGFLLPHLVYQEGARLIRDEGGRVLQNAEVTGATVRGDRIAEVHTAKGSFGADLFVDCTNAWTGRLAEAVGGQPLEVSPRKRYLWFLERDGPMTADELMAMPMTICPSGIYARPESRGQLLIGKKHPTRAEPGFDYEDQDVIEAGFSHKSGVDSMPFELWAQVAEVLPPVAEFGGVNATAGGYYAETPDHNPFLGYDRARPNLIRLVGFSGHGAMFGPFTARVAAALAEAGADVPFVDVDSGRVDLAAFRIGRSFSHSEDMVI